MRNLFPTNVPSTTSARSSLYFERRPDNIGKWRSFQKYIYDSQEGTVCNRTARSWGLFVVFYILFLIIVVGLFSALLFGIIEFLKLHYKQKPKIEKSL